MSRKVSAQNTAMFVSKYLLHAPPPKKLNIPTASKVTHPNDWFTWSSTVVSYMEVLSA